MARAISMTAQDRKWEGEEDARTLARAVEIGQDPARLKRAKNAANSLAKKAVAEANRLKKASGKKQ
ncbi:MAG TPA: hypothetical protein VFI02_14090 [Armatimonadota bacterium]|nr:hypothetical protein [Armatimonadota bacterium]